MDGLNENVSCNTNYNKYVILLHTPKNDETFVYNYDYCNFRFHARNP